MSKETPKQEAATDKGKGDRTRRSAKSGEAARTSRTKNRQRSARDAARARPRPADIPLAAGRVEKTGYAKVSPTPEGGLRIRTREYIGAVYRGTQGAGNAPVNEELSTVCPVLQLPDPLSGLGAFGAALGTTQARNQLTPANSLMFPLAAASASQYELFVFNKIRFRFVPAAAATTTGMILMATDADPADANSAIGVSSLMDFDSSSMGPTYREQVLDVKPSMLKKRGPLYVEDIATAANETVSRLRQTSVGAFYIYGQFIPANTSFGQLWVEYDVILINRQNDDTRTMSSGILTGTGTNLPTVIAPTGMIFGYTGNATTGTPLPPYSQIANKDVTAVQYSVGTTQYSGMELQHPGQYLVNVSVDGTGLGMLAQFCSDTLATAIVYTNLGAATYNRLEYLISVVSSPAVIYWTLAGVTTATNVVARVARFWPGQSGSGQNLVISPSIVQPGRAGPDGRPIPVKLLPAQPTPCSSGVQADLEALYRRAMERGDAAGARVIDGYIGKDRAAVVVRER